MDFVRMEIYREALKGYVGRAVECPECGRILNAPAAVYVADSNGEGVHVSCAACWGKMPMVGTFGSILVLDGRALWPTAPYFVDAHKVRKPRKRTSKRVK